jgi:hypothetical protein
MNKRLGEATAASVALPVGPFANAQDHSQLNLVPSASGIVPLTIPPRKEGDSYRTQRLPRWVPAACPHSCRLTSKPIRASPTLGYSTNLVFQRKNLGYRC